VGGGKVNRGNHRALIPEALLRRALAAATPSRGTVLHLRMDTRVAITLGLWALRHTIRNSSHTSSRGTVVSLAVNLAVKYLLHHIPPCILVQGTLHDL